MIAIADNLNSRNRIFMDAVVKKDKKIVADLAKRIRDAGAHMINVQCSTDGSGDEETLPWAVETVAGTSGTGICLDSRNVRAIERSLPLCETPPLVNFLSKTEPEASSELLHLVSKAGASIIIRASSGSIPSSIEAKLQILEVLLEKANEADIPNERIFADPSIVHIARGMGQKHLVNSLECIHALDQLIEPPVNTIAWISNISTGLPRAMRKPLEADFLIYMAGAGLNAAMVDVLDENIRKALYLIRTLRDEVVFSQAEMG